MVNHPADEYASGSGWALVAPRCVAPRPVLVPCLYGILHPPIHHLGPILALYDWYRLDSILLILFDSILLGAQSNPRGGPLLPGAPMSGDITIEGPGGLGINAESKIFQLAYRNLENWMPGMLC